VDRTVDDVTALPFAVNANVPATPPDVVPEMNAPNVVSYVIDDVAGKVTAVDFLLIVTDSLIDAKL
jgi:hypothetical protein